MGAEATDTTNAERRAFKEALLAQRRSRFPGFRQAVVADARVALAAQGRPAALDDRRSRLRSVLRLAWTSDAFLALASYRFKAAAQARGVPALPRLAHRVSMALAQICIGDPVILGPGVHIAHGQVVIDGMVEIGSGTSLGPGITIGLRAGEMQGPTIGPSVSIGSGAKVIGPVTVGAGATIEANSVVVGDVPPGATASGVPAVVGPPPDPSADPLPPG